MCFSAALLLLEGDVYGKTQEAVLYSYSGPRIHHDRMKKDITNQKFGRLIAKEIVRTIPGKGTIWRCECECGGEKEVLAAYFLEHWERIKMVMS